MRKDTLSYKIFNEMYFPIFNKLNNAENTIFENMDYRPPVDNLYEEFIQSPEYEMFLESKSRVEKQKIIINWIYENLFLESYLDVKYKLITENESLPYSIEYKLNNSYDVITEGMKSFTLSSIIGGAGMAAAHAYLGGILAPVAISAIAALTIIIGLSDKDRQNIINGFETAGKVIGKLVTLDIGLLDADTKKEILAVINSRDIADMFDECQKIVGWNPSDSSKFSRFIERITNSHKEYDYARCVGAKIIKFYVSLLETLYKIMKASNIDDKVFTVYQNSLNRGILNEALFRNIARLTRDKNLYKLLEVVNKVSNSVQKLIDTFNNSKDPEYVRIGHDLSKQLDSELRNLAYQIGKESKMRPALNRRDNEFFKEGKAAEHSRPDTKNFGTQKTSFDRNKQKFQHNSNPF